MTRSESDLGFPQANRAPSGERRLHRSQNMEKALALLLDSARRRQGYAVLAVADTSGLLVAGSGHFAECEELAAYAPLGSPPRPRRHQRREVETLTVDGISVLVTGVDARQPGLAAVVAGCARILGRNRHSTAPGSLA